MEAEVSRDCSTFETINTYIILVGKPERKKSLEMSRCRREGDIRMALNDIRWTAVDRIRTAQDQEQFRNYSFCMNGYSHVPLAGTESCQDVVTLICDICLYIYCAMTPECRYSGAIAKVCC